MKPFSLLPAAALVLLAACGQPEPEVIDSNPDPMAAELANRAPVELPPAIRADKSFRCRDNSLVWVAFFQGDEQVNVRLQEKGKPTTLKATEAGGPYTAEGGWTFTGNDEEFTLEQPGKPTRSCHQ